MKPSVYLETTIPSYLTAREGGDLVFRANRQLTIEWWQTQRAKYDLFVSQFVLDEASAGDPEAPRGGSPPFAIFPFLMRTKDVEFLRMFSSQRSRFRKRPRRTPSISRWPL